MLTSFELEAKLAELEAEESDEGGVVELVDEVVDDASMKFCPWCPLNRLWWWW